MPDPIPAPTPPQAASSASNMGMTPQASFFSGPRAFSPVVASLAGNRAGRKSLLGG
jgi:hypothetical protein